MKLKQSQNVFDVIANANATVQLAIQTNYGITKQCECESYRAGKKR